MATLYILCGPSGCGKSTWSRQYIAFEDALGNDIRYVSRDEIRFSMLKEGEDYFAHEKEVFKRFVDTIRLNLISGFDVIADATHLNAFSRRKLTQAIDMYYTDYKIIYVTFIINVETCVARNAHRDGRANVPDNIIRNMCRDFRTPSLDEDERAIDIIEVSD